MLPPAKSVIDSNGDVHLPSLTVPFSSLASLEAKKEFIRSRERFEKVSSDIARFSEVSAENIGEQRQSMVNIFRDCLERTKVLYSVAQENRVVGGVPCEIFTAATCADKAQSRPVLVNLHAGSFLMGAHIFSAMESIPMAALGGFTVVSVDYRLGPEHKFPAATEDVVSVYKELVKEFNPADIGIYGCSAGGILTAQTVAFLSDRKIPLPGAVGILAASACGSADGDSGSLAMPLTGMEMPAALVAPPHPEVYNNPYFSDANMNDPLVLPIRSDAVLRRFPPTLLITSTRDTSFSGAAHTHAQLVKNGVEADLHVWDGLPHAFFSSMPDLPETLEVWAVTKRFFEHHLGQSGDRGQIGRPANSRHKSRK